jgi:hypothetical protein
MFSVYRSSLRANVNRISGLRRPGISKNLGRVLGAKHAARFAYRILARKNPWFDWFFSDILLGRAAQSLRHLRVRSGYSGAG